MGKGTIITLISIGILGAIIAFWAIGLSNTYNVKLETGRAAQKNSEIVFDNTWKKISGQAGVAAEYKSSFKEVYVEIMDARYKNDAGAGKETLMKWITESNPEFDASLFKTVMNTIEGSRNEFTMEQKKLIDIDRELKSMKVTFPNSLVLGNKPDLEIKLVTSAKTKEAFETGEENDGVDPFEKK
jgi:hypothetical protein